MGLLRRTFRRIPQAIDPGSATRGGTRNLNVSNQNSNMNTVHGSGDILNYNTNNITYIATTEALQGLDRIHFKITAALEERHVPKAVYDAHRSSGCMEGTRVQILHDIETWIQNQKAPQIFWLTGMAGTGKTSIGWTVCSRANKHPEIVLAGSFFCSHSTGSIALRDVRCIVPTLAQLFARQSVVFAQALAAELARDPDVLHKQVEAQVRQLLYQPLLVLKDSPVPILFVIDALDECGGHLTTDTASDDAETHRIVSEMLEALVAFSRAETKLPVKFFITSRPETHIRDTPVSDSKFSTFLRLHTVDKEQVTKDIHLLISTRLSSGPRLRVRFSENEFGMLARLCDGLFIFATTALLYILADGSDVAAERFETLLNATRDGLSTGAAVPLDRMYALILEDATRADKSRTISIWSVQQLLASLLSSRMTLSVAALADLLDLPVSRVRASMSRLHAVVQVPDEDEEPGLRILHVSFGDYLISRAPFDIRIPSSLGDQILSDGCVRVMEKRLHFNVSQSISSHYSNPRTKNTNMRLALEYACLHWIYHISRLPDPSTLEASVSSVFRPRLLFWLEAMSVLGKVWRAVTMLFFAAATVKDTDLSQFLRDAHAFAASSHEAIQRSAPHIYISALPFADKDSLVYTDFSASCIGIIAVDLFGIGTHGSRLFMTLTGHENRVTSLSYSPDGRLIASGSEDDTLRVWDTRTGEEAKHPLRSGDGSVLSVSFAPDGRKLASATVNGVVCMWDLLAGQTTPRRQRSHSDAVLSVTFSFDGRVLAAASADMTVTLWNVESGQLLSILRGHTGEVNTIAFSRDGMFLVSGSDDGTIRTWRTASNKPWGELVRAVNSELLRLTHGIFGRPTEVSDRWIDGGVNAVSISPNNDFMVSASRRLDLWTGAKLKSTTSSGRYESIRSVQFSPDGQTLAFTTDEMSIRQWGLADPAAGDSSVLVGMHVDRVNFVSFSPDGLYIASASDDGTIRIWSGDTGKLAALLPVEKDHRAMSVATSPSGDFIVSGSADCSVELWSMRNRAPRYTRLSGHRDIVYAVDVAPDGLLVASASGDHTVRLWNALTGELVARPMRPHQNAVYTVKFSPNGRWLAMGSRDATMLVLDVATQQPLDHYPMRCNGAVLSVAFSPDNQLIASSDGRGYIHVCMVQISSDSTQQQFQANLSPVNSIGFSPDGVSIVSGGGDHKIRIWEVRTGKEALVLNGHSGSVTSVAYSPDSRHIGSGSADETARLWDATTGATLWSIQIHKHRVQSVAFTVDGRYLMSGSWDETIRLWDLNTLLSPELFYDPLTALRAARYHEGWLVGSSGELLLWVPSEYRPYLPVPLDLRAPPCTLLMRLGKGIVLGAGEDGWNHGESWTMCWRET